MARDEQVLDYRDFGWQSDWNGDEVGYAGIEVVGLYSMIKYPIDVYIDISTGRILEAWCNNFDDDYDYD